MQNMTFLSTSLMPDGSIQAKILGRCDNCDFDATWWIESGTLREFNLEQYFFG